MAMPSWQMQSILIAAGTVGLVAGAAYVARQRAAEAKQHADDMRELVDRAEKVQRHSAEAADDLIQTLSGVYDLG